MKERPILFSAPMVKAILAGAKTMTRRIVKPQQPKPSRMDPYDLELTERDGSITAYTTAQFVERCPYGVVGDRLWVKETFQPLWSGERRPASMSEPNGWDLNYVATGGIREYRDDEHGLTTRCKPAIFMPRWASRITLDITNVRVERLHDISEEDAKAEGVERDTEPCDHTRLSCEDVGCMGPTHRSSFAELWQQINGVESWDAKPFVWVISFRRVEQLRSVA